MNRVLSILAVVLVSSAVAVFAQGKSEYIDGTEQIANHNFENFDNLGKDEVEPSHWNSFMTCGGTYAGSAKGQQLDRSTEKRPGTTGQYSVRIWSKSIIGILANGNLTTGRVNAGDWTPSSPSNYNYTERGNPAHSHPFSSIPDSVVVWVKFIPKNASDEGGFEVILHDDNNTSAPNGNENQHVAYVKAIIKKQNGDWQRISVPLGKNGLSTDVRYCLINASTNRNAGGGSGGDELFIDDLLFVYNPKLTLGKVPSTIGFLSGNAATFNIPYTLSGTMNPYNNKPDNKVIVELSDINGAFENPLVIGEVTTSASGTVACTVPTNIELGKGYRIRIRTTNYPMTTPDNGEDIEIFNAYMVNAVAANHRGTVSGSKGVQKQNSTVSLSANANPGNIFTHWEEEGNTIANAGSTYTFFLDRDRNLTAYFDTASYRFTLANGGGGSVIGSADGNYLHNEVISLNATADTGYDFSGYFENNVQIAASAEYSFKITKDRNIEARFIPRKYLVNLTVNNALYGSVAGGGLLNYNAEVALSATAKPYCKFIAWISNGDTLGKLPALNYTVKRAATITAVFAEIRYQVVVNRNPVSGGTVSGAGTYSAFNANTNITLTASASISEGYKFKRFVDDSTGAEFLQNPFVFLSGGRLTSAKSFTAYFELNKYNIAADALPLAAGTVSGAGIYEHGANVSLNAVAAEGYEFVAWLSGSDTVYRSAEVSFVADRDTVLNAVFRLKQYNIGVLSNNDSYGSVSGGGVYKHFSQAVLTADAAEGYEFRYWTIDGNIIDSVSPLNYTVTSAVNIEAVFSIIRKNVIAQVLPLAAGSVSGAGRFEHNAQVVLTASASTGYKFVRWENTLGDSVDGVPTLRFNVIYDTCLVARFAPIPYKITIASGSSTNGKVSFNGTDYSSSTIDSVIPYGTTLPLFASIANTEYKFIGWKKFGSSEIISVSDTFYYTVTKDESLVAAFSNSAVSISASAQPSDAGIVEGNGNYERDGWYPLRAVPNYGYRVKEWQTVSGLSLGRADSLMVEAKKDTSFIVVFEKDSFDVSVSGAGVLGTVSGAGRYCYKDTAMLGARNNENYHFVAWYENGAVISTDSVIKIEIDRAYNLTALFDSNEVSLTVMSSHPNNSIVSASKLSKYGRTEILTAVAGEGIHFVGWKYGADTLRNDTANLLMLEDCTVTALFDTNKYNINVAVSASAGGCFDVVFGASDASGTLGISCVQNYSEELYYNASVKIVAVANYGYYSSFDTLSLIVRKDTNINIEFFKNNITVQASCDAEQGYTSVGGGNGHYYGDEVRIEAVANDGYKFVKWTLASDTAILFSKYSVVSFVAENDTELVAHFEKAKFDVWLDVSNEYAGRVAFGSFAFGSGFVQVDTVLDFNSAVTVSAYPLYGYHFSYWEINGVTASTDSIYQIPQITGETSVVAVFEANLYSVDLLWEPSICGEALGNGIFAYGSTVEIKAIPAKNFFFDRWLSQSEFVSFDSVYSFTLTKDTVFTAVFRTDTFDVNVDVATVGGNASGGGRFLLGQEVSVAAENNYGYVFSEWQDNNGISVSRENPFVFNASENISLNAVFVPQTFNIKINSNAADGADIIRGDGNHHYGDYACLLALSDNINTFSYWEISEELAGDSIFTAEELLNNVLFYHVEKDLEIRAVYQIKKYNVSATASPIVGGSVFNTGDYVHGSSFVLEAIPAAHYHFVNWVYNGEMVSDSIKLPVDSLSSDMEFVATFEKDRHLIRLECTPLAGGVLNGGGDYNYGDTAILSVALNPGYSLKEWLDREFKPVGGGETSFQYIVKGSNILTAVLVKDASTEFVGEGERVRVYPNPVSSLLYVDGAGTAFGFGGGGSFGGGSFVSAVIIDFTGRQVLKANSSPIDVSSLRAGAYLLRIEFSDGSVLTRKLVIQ